MLAFECRLPAPNGHQKAPAAQTLMGVGEGKGKGPETDGVSSAQKMSIVLWHWCLYYYNALLIHAILLCRYLGVL